MPDRIAILLRVKSEPGVLHRMSGVIAERQGNITSVSILHGDAEGEQRTYFEIDFPGDVPELLASLGAISHVREVTQVRSFGEIYGKRIIIVGGGAQVAQVALGAISEADRHNLRGERISVDTIPLLSLIHI